MNELNYLNMARMKLTLENTLKNDSSNLLIHNKRERALDEIKLNEVMNKLGFHKEALGFMSFKAL